MNNVTNKFKEALLNGNRKFYCYARITLTNGTVLYIDNSHICEGGWSISDSVSGDNAFEVGAFILGRFELKLDNYDGAYTDYVFEDATVVASIGLIIDESPETIQKGIYIVQNAAGQNSSVVTLDCLDRGVLFNKPYSESHLTYPATLKQIVLDACTVCGVTLNTTSFDNDNFIIQTRPEGADISFGRVVSCAAQIAGKYVRLNYNGQLTLDWYDESEVASVYPITTHTDAPLTDENDDVLQGSFPASKQDYIDGNIQTSMHRIVSLDTDDIALDDITITGAKVVVDAGDGDVSAFVGTDGYVLSIENNVLVNADNMDAVAAILGQALIGLTFRPISLSALSDPTIEAGDRAYVIDLQQNVYLTYINNLSFTVGDYEHLSCEAEIPSRNNPYNLSEETKNYVKLRQAIQTTRGLLDQGYAELDERINNTSGFYLTEETQPDGSVISYTHNKPTLAESSIIWKETAETRSVSTDGGTTWNAGLTADGNAILHILSAEGINANWINAGLLQVVDDDGNRIFMVDMDTKQFYIDAQYTNIKLASGDETTLNGAFSAIDTKVDRLSTTFQNTYTAKADAIVGQQTWYYSSTSPTQMLGGNWSTAAPTWATNTYVWTKVRYIKGDGTYTETEPVCTTGSTGPSGSSSSVTITGQSVQYQVSDSGTVTPTTWGAEGVIPTVPAGKYLWTRTAVTYSDNTNVVSYSVAYQGENGAGVSATSKKVQYAASADGTNPPAESAWQDAVPLVDPTAYLWTRTVITYSDGTDTTAYSVARQGGNGTSVTITSRSVKYQAGTSATEAPTGAWLDTVPPVVQGEYLWTQTIVNYSDGGKTEAYSVARQGQNGTGVTITSRQILYAEGTSGTTPPADSEFGASIPEVTQGNFLWTKVVVNYSDNTSTTSYSVALQPRDGTDAYYLSITARGSLITAKENASTATLTGCVGQGESTDIDPNGTQFTYAWYMTPDGGEEGYYKSGKTITIDIDRDLCSEHASVRFAITDDSDFLYLQDAIGNILTDQNETPLGVS